MSKKATPGENKTGPEEKDSRENQKGDGLVGGKSKEAKNINARATDAEKATMQAEDNERAGHPKVSDEEKGPSRPAGQPS